MPYERCPACGGRFQTGASICLDCGNTSLDRTLARVRPSAPVPDEHIRRAALREVDLAQLRSRLCGAEYRELVQEHMRRLGHELEPAILGCVLALTDAELGLADVVIHSCNVCACERSFWRRDCGQVLTDICSAFERMMLEAGLTASEGAKFAVFQLATMNFALAARESKQLRKFAGIRKGFLTR